MWNEMWDEWVRSFSNRIMTTDNRFDSQTKSLTFNPKIYSHDNARDRNNLMRKSKADDSWMLEDLILLSYCLHWLKVVKIGWLDKMQCVLFYTLEAYISVLITNKISNVWCGKMTIHVKYQLVKQITILQVMSEKWFL